MAVASKMKWLEVIGFLIILMSSVGLTAYVATQLNSTFSKERICKFSIKYDLDKLHPLLLQSTKSDFYLPQNGRGDIILKSGDVIWLSCPGGSVFINGRSSGKEEISATCVNNKLFEDFNRTQSDIGVFKCDIIKSVARYNRKSCLQKYKQIDIGFQQMDGNFIQQLNVCFDKTNQTTVYTVSNITASIVATELNSSRPYFEEGNFYDLGKFKLQYLYTKNIHKKNILQQLGMPNKNYFDSNFLTRGHLAPNSDHVYNAQKNTTFYFVNAAPQWQTFNAGNWESVESNVRYYASRYRRNLIVYTGTHDIATLPNMNGRETPLYLYNANGKRGIPLPKFYWKIVHEPKSNAGVAFIGLNNPFATNVANDILCQDICQEITWLQMNNRRNYTEGYTYCCLVSDLQRKITNIPKLKITKLLV